MTLSPEDYAAIRNLWVVLALVVAGLLGLTIVTYRRCRRLWSMRQLSRAQTGAAYSMTMVITMPIYALLVCMIIETTLTLQLKIGAVYATFAGARGAVVYWPSEMPQEAIEKKVKTATVQAIAPFASSRSEHLQGISIAGGDAPQADDLYRAYATYCDGPISLDCLRYKLKYAWLATDVSVTQSDPNSGEPSSAANANLTVTVRYQMPFHTAIGYLLGGTRSAGGLCLREIRTTVTLQKEGVKSKTQTLGIHYDPDHN
jgi:hypothetical protein